MGETIRLNNLSKKLVERYLKNLLYKFGEKFIGKIVQLNLLKNWILYFLLINCVENWVENWKGMLGGKILRKIFLWKNVYSVMCTLNSAPQFVEEALVFLSLGSYLGSHLQRRWFQLSDKVGLIIQQW